MPNYGQQLVVWPRHYGPITSYAYSIGWRVMAAVLASKMPLSSSEESARAALGRFLTPGSRLETLVMAENSRKSVSKQTIGPGALSCDHYLRCAFNDNILRLSPTW